LNSLLEQSVADFAIIVSEDCQSTAIKDCVDSYRSKIPGIVHLSQEDIGFRKNIALNRAIRAANSDHIIFIDGDCVPHSAFVEAHQQFAQAGIACTGRRLELGENVSKKLREGKIRLSYLTNKTSYLLHMIPLLLDKAKNIESGIYSRFLHSRTQDKEIRILGCNFSCSKSDLIKINGFNEEYLAAGIGEDSDIDWRLIHTGVTIKNVKFSAIQYHLYHPRFYSPSKENEAILNRTKEQNLFFCEKGLRK
jgi:glycosyltransferase involved in cell wall biosynthesis